MKIVFYHSSLNKGGAERVITNLSNYFVQHGHKVFIIVIDDSKPDYELNEKVKFINLYKLTNNSNFIKSIIYHLKLSNKLRKLLIRFDPDIVLTFGVSQLLDALFARRRLKYKLIGSERSNPFNHYSGKLWGMVKRILYKKTDGFIFQTKGASRFYTQNLRNRDVIISNPLSEDFQNKNLIHCSDRNRRNFCTIGRLSYEKSHDFLIKSFVAFHVKYPECRLIIYGEGSKREFLEKLIHELKAENYIEMPGRIDAVFEELNQYRYFILSSCREGMPNALIEAMASGCACISTDCPFGPGELIRNEENGLLIPVNDEEKLIVLMEKLYNNESLCEKLSINAQAIRDKNSVKNIANKYIAFFQYIVRM